MATGLLISEQRARDIKIASFSLALHGKNLVEDTTIELSLERLIKCIKLLKQYAYEKCSRSVISKHIK